MISSEFGRSFMSSLMYPASAVSRFAVMIGSVGARCLCVGIAVVVCVVNFTRVDVLGGIWVRVRGAPNGAWKN